MANIAPFPPNVSSPNSSRYRERKDEEWSPRSRELESDHKRSLDSNEDDEENHESRVITISDSSSGLSSHESSPRVPWSENTSFSRSSRSTSLNSRCSKVNQEECMVTQENVSKSCSLVVGKRPRAVWLKDVDLTRKPIRETKDDNEGPKKSHMFSPISSGSSVGNETSSLLDIPTKIDFIPLSSTDLRFHM